MTRKQKRKIIRNIKTAVVSLIAVIIIGIVGHVDYTTMATTNDKPIKTETELHVRETELEYYAKMAAEYPIEIINSSQLSIKKLQNRNGTIIIEKCIGKVLDSKGNGEVLNCNNPKQNYISYRSVENAGKSDILLTYFIYNPETNAEDDIIFRFDYIMEEGK